MRDRSFSLTSVVNHNGLNSDIFMCEIVSNNRKEKNAHNVKGGNSLESNEVNEEKMCDPRVREWAVGGNKQNDAVSPIGHLSSVCSLFDVVRLL